MLGSDLPLDDVLTGFLHEVSLLAVPDVLTEPSKRAAPSAPASPVTLDTSPAAWDPSHTARGTLEALRATRKPAAPATIRGGPEEKAGAASAPSNEPNLAQRQALLSSLEAVGRSSRLLIWLWVGLIIGVFVLIVSLTVYHRDNLGFVAGSILGGSGAMAALLQQVRGVHTRLVSTQLLLSLLPTLAPAQWRTAVQSLLDEVLNKPARRRK